MWQVFVDDLMLRAEGDLADMTLDELRDACDLRCVPAMKAALPRAGRRMVGGSEGSLRRGVSDAVTYLSRGRKP